MRLSYVRILNFKSCRKVEINVSGLHALVGSNNAGKSNILHALDFLFNPSVKKLSEDSFWNKRTDLAIRVEAVFTDFDEIEKQKLDPYLTSEGCFHIAREARLNVKDSSSDSEGQESKYSISQQYKKSIPNIEWLQLDQINGQRIGEWWKNKDELIVNEHRFTDYFMSQAKPTVSDWKEQAQKFIDEHNHDIEFIEKWIDNPQGYANVLKSSLPCFVMVPAVKDVTDESKGTKSSPFGKLIYSIIDQISNAHKDQIKTLINDITNQLNRNEHEIRIPIITQTEQELKNLLNDVFPDCDLEIQFETPSFEMLMSTPKIFIDDGLKNSVENKGHGIQRAVIFAILRRYADLVSINDSGEKKKMIIAIEEPELYMHPQAQRTLRGVFKRIADNGDQVIYSTHSSLMVDVAYFDEIIRVENVKARCGSEDANVSNAYQLTMHDLIQDLTRRYPGTSPSDISIRDHYSNAYNPRRNEGFFATKILLVEGMTEEYSLPIYADKILGRSFDSLGVSVVECGSKCSIDRLYRIFNELHIPCYIIMDYDHGNSDSNIIKISKDLLKLAGENEDYHPTLFVSDRIAYFPKTIEEYLRTILRDYDKLVEEARKELCVKKDGSKPLIGRFIARKMCSAGAPPIPEEFSNLIKKAVSVEWTSSCLSASTVD